MKLKWTTKEGKKMWIKDMSDSHILNCLKMLKKFAENEYSYAERAIFSYPQPHGDGAQMELERAEMQIMNSTWEDFVPEEYYALLKEAKKRGIG